MFTTLRPYLFYFLQALFIFTALSLLIDWWRQPTQPIQSANQPLTLLSGKNITLAELSRQQVAVLYFWGSWCGICRYTSPQIEQLHQTGIPVLSIAMHSGNATDISSYLRQHHLTLPTVNDSDGLISQQWQVSVTPTIILLKNGQMIHHTSRFSTHWGLRSRIAAINAWY